MQILINKEVDKYRAVDNTVWQHVSIFKCEISDSIISPPSTSTNELSVQDSEALQIGLNHSANEWAVENCLEHAIYIYKGYDVAEFAIRLLAKVYLTPEQITYWRLKSGQ